MEGETPESWGVPGEVGLKKLTVGVQVVTRLRRGSVGPWSLGVTGLDPCRVG